MCKHADRITGRKRDKEKERDAEGEKSKVERERTTTNEAKGVKLTCPAAGGACPPSPGFGLAGLCWLPPAL